MNYDLTISLPKTSGVYEIKNVVTGERCVGQAINIRKRIRTHLQELKRDGHSNFKLMNNWIKFGEAAFDVNILHLCKIEELNKNEQAELNKKPELNIAYSVYPTRLGAKLSEETKAKISLSKTGKPLSAETKLKIGVAGVGRKDSEETKKKKSAAHKGRSISIETRGKISKSKIGIALSEEARLERKKYALRGPAHSGFGKPLPAKTLAAAIAVNSSVIRVTNTQTGSVDIFVGMRVAAEATGASIDQVKKRCKYNSKSSVKKLVGVLLFEYNQ